MKWVNICSVYICKWWENSVDIYEMGRFFEISTRWIDSVDIYKVVDSVDIYNVDKYNISSVKLFCQMVTISESFKLKC